MWLAGYAHRDRPSQGTRCELFAKALAIEDETGKQFVIVTTDILGFPRSVASQITTQIKQKHGISREHLMLTSSHTHSGPVIGDCLLDMYDLDEEQRGLVDQYTEELIEYVLEAVGQALKDLEPCTLFWTVGSADFAANRREYTLEGVIIGLNPIGPTDHDVPVLRVQREDGSSKAVLFGYACHNTVLDLCEFSGDYAGYAQQFLEEQHPGMLCLFVIGCGADQNPMPRRSIELAMKFGQELADAVSATFSKQSTEVCGPLHAVYEEIPLPFRYQTYRKELDDQIKGGNEYLRRTAARLHDRLKEKGNQPATYPYPIQIWRFADVLQMTVLGGEVVVDYSLRLKHDLGHEKHFVIAYANDVMGYIPSLRILNEGGYEADFSMVYYGHSGTWAPQVEGMVLDTVRRLTDESRTAGM
jgi:hypothetical protein